MAKINIKEKFPCGYEKEINYNSLGSDAFVKDDGKGCPLHGLSCSNKLKSKSKRR